MIDYECGSWLGEGDLAELIDDDLFALLLVLRRQGHLSKSDGLS